MFCIGSLWFDFSCNRFYKVYKFPQFIQSYRYILGCGDFSLQSLSLLPDPCPLPDKTKKRSLNEREKVIYAPMAGVGGILYDKVGQVTS